MSENSAEANKEEKFWVDHVQKRNKLKKEKWSKIRRSSKQGELQKP